MLLARVRPIREVLQVPIAKSRATRQLLMAPSRARVLQAAVFCGAVLAALDGDMPVLGVLQKADTAFLRAVAAHPRVRVVTVTEENRDRLRQELQLHL